MTPEQFQKDRTGLLMDYRYLLLNWAQDQSKPTPKIEDVLGALNELDAEYAAAQSNPYYTFLNTLDRNYAALKQAEGRPDEERHEIDRMMSTLAARAEQLERGK